MGKFEFVQQVKCMIIKNNTFEIEAESLEQAEEIAKKHRYEDISQSSDFEDIESEYLSDTETVLEPWDNNGRDTMWIFHNGELVAGNK